MKKNIVLTIILTVAIVSGLSVGCGTKESVETTAPINNVERDSNVTKKAVKNHIIRIHITADKGFDKDSTPAIAHIVSKDKKVDFYHAVTADETGGKGSSTVELETGAYTVEFVSPLNKDGSAYEIYDTGKAQDIKVGEDSKDVEVECPMKQIPADKVTDEMVKDIVKKTQEAVEKGDDTLKGDAGKDVLEKLDKNVEQNPNVSEETKKETEEAKEAATAEGKTDGGKAETTGEKKGTDNQGTQTSNNNQGAQTSNNNQNNQPQAGQNQNSGQSSNTNGNAGTKAEQPAAPKHEHAWKQHTSTTTTWVPNIVNVPDYGEQEVGSEWHCNCGAVIQGNTDDHVLQHILNGEPDNGYRVPIYNTVIVGYHQEDHGSYVTTTVNDYQYCDCGATR